MQLTLKQTLSYCRPNTPGSTDAFRRILEYEIRMDKNNCCAAYNYSLYCIFNGYSVYVYCLILEKKFDSCSLCTRETFKGNCSANNPSLVRSIYTSRFPRQAPGEGHFIIIYSRRLVITLMRVRILVSDPLR